LLLISELTWFCSVLLLLMLLLLLPFALQFFEDKH
jgi:hypothetical protein